VRLAAALAAIACALPLRAHDLLTAEAVERYLRDAEKWRSSATAAAPPAQRAEALYRIGVMLDEVRDLLNADLAAHGKVQGLPSSYLIAELSRLGMPLARAAAGGRFLANRHYFEAALKLAPGAALAADAGLRLLQAGFYESFEQDPLDWRGDRHELAAQIALAEGLLQSAPAHVQREEIDFIAAILYTRAARMRDTGPYAAKAREATAAFAARYPDSLRAAAMPMLREALSP
jgi:hypothetical protein